jgi:hypothetical protein
MVGRQVCAEGERRERVRNELLLYLAFTSLYEATQVTSDAVRSLWSRNQGQTIQSHHRKSASHSLRRLCHPRVDKLGVQAAEINPAAVGTEPSQTATPRHYETVVVPARAYDGTC